jgi:hypothetical protein
MKLGDPLFPKPSARQMKQAFKVFGHGNPPAQTPRELLRMAGRWLTEYRMFDADSSSDGDMAKLAYSPEVEAVWMAFQCFGLPTYRPDYLEWLDRCRPGEFHSGAMLDDADGEMLQLYLQAAHRSEKWSPGSWAIFIHEGGLMRAVGRLFDLLDSGDWAAPWN